jgi:hypothetical protein
MILASIVNSWLCFAVLKAETTGHLSKWPLRLIPDQSAPGWLGLAFPFLPILLEILLTTGNTVKPTSPLRGFSALGFEQVPGYARRQN